MVGVTLLLVVGAVACNEAASEPVLDRERVLAVRVSPPHLLPGDVGAIDVLVGRADGTVAVVPPDLVAVGDGGGPAGERMLTTGETGWSVTCPPDEALAALRDAAGLPPDAAVVLPLEVVVVLDGEELGATKSVILGMDGDNPSLAGMTIDADDDGGPLVIDRDAEIDIAADGAEVGDGEPSYAWYSSVGDIDLYRSATAVLSTGDAATGQLVLVVRDDAGGVTWAWRDVRVE
jgi:hypothetical protein